MRDQHTPWGFALSLPLLTGLLASLAACSQTPPPAISSTLIAHDNVIKIQHTIAQQYPKADAELQQHILKVAVKALDNMVFIKGGSYIMGDFGMPCEFDNVGLITWTPDNSACFSYVDNARYGTTHLHKVTLSH